MFIYVLEYEEVENEIINKTIRSIDFYFHLSFFLGFNCF